MPGLETTISIYITYFQLKTTMCNQYILSKPSAKCLSAVCVPIGFPSSIDVAVRWRQREIELSIWSGNSPIGILNTFDGIVVTSTQSSASLSKLMNSRPIPMFPHSKLGLHRQENIECHGMNVTTEFDRWIISVSCVYIVMARTIYQTTIQTTCCTCHSFCLHFSSPKETHAQTTLSLFHVGSDLKQTK